MLDGWGDQSFTELLNRKIITHRRDLSSFLKRNLATGHIRSVHAKGKRSKYRLAIDDRMIQKQADLAKDAFEHIRNEISKLNSIRTSKERLPRYLAIFFGSGCSLATMLYARTRATESRPQYQGLLRGIFNGYAEVLLECIRTGVRQDRATMKRAFDIWSRVSIDLSDYRKVESMLPFYISSSS